MVVDEGLRFQKTKILSREEEFLKLFAAVRTRLIPFAENLHLLPRNQVALEARLNKLIEDFDNLYDHFENRKGRKRLTDKNYREIKRDLNRLKYVSFLRLKARYLEIALVIDGFGISFEY